MAEINFNIMSPISANKVVKGNHSQKIVIEKSSQGASADSSYENIPSYAATERIKTEVSGLEVSTGQVNDSISMLETIEGFSAEISFALNQMKGLATQAAEKTLSVTDRAVLDFEFGQLSKKELTAELLPGSAEGVVPVASKIPESNPIFEFPSK